jgi:phosphate transport system substrate-binding protein
MRSFLFVGLIAFALPLAGCGNAPTTAKSEVKPTTGKSEGAKADIKADAADDKTEPAKADNPRITAGGATFVNPVMQAWAKEYKKAQIDYLPQGSGYGITEMTKQSLAFGCSDAPMNKKEMETAKASNGDVIHVPLAVGAVALIYNLDGVKNLKLTGDVVADIYMRKITKWNDPAIAKLNPGAALPDKTITPVARIESSGTTFIFAEYLGKRSPAFKGEGGPRVSKTPQWPNGVEKKKENSGIAEFVKSTPYTIGYVELAFAKTNDIPTAALVNKYGKEVAPDAASVTAAVEGAMKHVGAKGQPYDLHPLAYSFTDAEGDGVYPIVGASYAILYKKQPKDKGPAVVDFLKWVVTDGQKLSAEKYYAPLPADLSKKAVELLGTVTFAP